MLGGFSKEQVASAIAECGFDPKIRGERLSCEDFARLSNALFEIKNEHN
jgi:16S rRNA (adenine1518-N6/adenine1519-N6)-dimethyltransferase